MTTSVASEIHDRISQMPSPRRAETSPIALTTASAIGIPQI
jgi:hypothetical protein